MRVTKKITTPKHLQKLVVILGPTAGGKTNVSVELAKRFEGFVISADSCQVYKEMNTGTAKITEKEMHGVPHYMIDMVTPDQPYSVAKYKKEVDVLIKKKENLPLLVGGTMQYIDAVADNWIIPPVRPDDTLREKLTALSLEKLQAQLQTFDPEAYAIIDLKNKRKVVRALEIIKTMGISPTRARRRGRRKYDVLKIGITRPREELYERINKRVDAMIANGLLGEVESLVKKYGWDAPGMQAVGYKEFRPYFEGEATLKECTGRLQQATRNYVKRQMTWWKRDEKIRWVTSHEEAQKYIADFLGQ